MIRIFLRHVSQTMVVSRSGDRHDILYRCIQASALLCMLFAAGCVSHVRDLRDAEDQFSTAAGIENRIRLGEPADAGDPVMLRGQADSAYRLAIKMLSDAIEKSGKELLRDRLLGTAYTLKAMAEWRVGEYAAALRTLEESRSVKGNELFPRDRSLQDALEGLIRNDQAVAHMRARDYPYQDIKKLLTGALESIDRGLRETAKGDGVRLYLLLAKLGTLKNWIDLRGEPEQYALSWPPDFNGLSEIREWCVSADPVWSEFVRELSSLEQERAVRTRVYWGKTLTMPATCSQPVP